MAYISDRDAAIFKEASIPAIDNFTTQDLEQIGKLAQELKPILEAAKKRKQESLKKKAS
jgi:hypothetical protein